MSRQRTEPQQTAAATEGNEFPLSIHNYQWCVTGCPEVWGQAGGDDERERKTNSACKLKYFFSKEHSSQPRAQLK